MIDKKCYIKSVTSDFKKLGIVFVISISIFILLYAIIICALNYFVYLTAYNLYILMQSLIIAMILVITILEDQHLAKAESVFTIIIVGFMAISVPFILYIIDASHHPELYYPSIIFVTVLDSIILLLSIPFALAYARCKTTDFKIEIEV